MQGLIRNLFRATSYEEILSGMVDTLTHKLSVEKCLIAEYTDGFFKVKTSRGYSSLFQRTFKPFLDDPFLSSLFLAEEARMLSGPNIFNDSGSFLFLFPLVIKKKVIGLTAMSRAEEFTPAETGELELFSIMTAFIIHAIALEEKLRHSTIYDEDTGIYNASYFKIKISECSDRIKRYNEGFAVLYLKYRHFTQIKRKYGSHVIEESYKDLTALIKNHIRDIDTLSRYGGCNFLIVFQTFDEEYILNMAERLNNTLKAHLKKINIEAGFDMGLVHIKEYRKLGTIMETLEDAVYESERTGSIVVQYL